MTVANSLTIALVGNPNCGKTTLFNTLTGAKQQVGNWPGVTVERKMGSYRFKGQTIEVVDLPGVYSLTVAAESAIDERIACEFILARQADVIVNIVDASQLERNLYVTMQLLEMQVPMIVAVNMMDIAEDRGQKIVLSELQKQLGCPVIALQAHKKKGVNELRHYLSSPLPLAGEGNVRGAHEGEGRSPVCAPSPSAATPLLPLPLRGRGDLLAAVQQITQLLPHQDPWLAMRLLEDDSYAIAHVSKEILSHVKTLQQTICETHGEDADILFADARYQTIQTIVQASVTHFTSKKINWTKHIDRFALHRIFGIPIFLTIMYLMFFCAMHIGGALQDIFDNVSNKIFVDDLTVVLQHLQFPTWLTVLLAQGVGKGINAIITFVPVLAAMFLCLALLEDSGYMTRAALVIDRLMRVFGLPGKAFVPMIIGFGCNVPAVMATRTLEHQRDRILTIMMTPFMSCGARLAIYAVFVAAFFPHQSHNIVFLLYVIGIVMALLTGLLLRKTVLQGEVSPLAMELSPYHLPQFTTIALHAWQRLKGFVFRAGKLIVPICVLVGILNSIQLDGSWHISDGSANSLLSYIGKILTPVFAPLGIHQDNWPATVGLLTGTLAKEVVIGTLNALYGQVGFVTHFDGKVGAFSYLLFVLLYFPCVSTIAVMLRELNRNWAIFSVLWTTGVAYAVSVLFYQLATAVNHPLLSMIWISGVLTAIAFTIFMLRRNAYELASH